MPAFAQVVLSDRASTPVAHPFLPIDTAGGVSTLRKLGTVPIADKTLKVRTSKTSGNRRIVEIKLTVPVVVTETINGVDRPTFERSIVATFTLNSGELSTPQERADAVGMLSDALKANQTMLNDVLVNNAEIFGA